MIEEQLLKSEERAVYSLRALYRQYGYLPFKMSKFEEYDLYVKNKDFLVSDRVITFTDTNGRLMALKPDVTLSIVKNGEDVPGFKQKVCYNETVYRVSGSTKQFREIMQSGLECIGDIDIYDVFEVVLLAAKSLELMAPDFVLDVSHQGLLEAALEQVSDDETVRKETASLIAGKNLHDLGRLMKKHGVCREAAEMVYALASLGGGMDKVLERLTPICRGKAAVALDELRTLRDMLSKESFADRIRFDFSMVSDMDYYNGIVFKGFLSGVSESALSGGQYDKLMEKLGRSSRAIGFGVYLDALEGLKGPRREYDADVLLVYDEDVPADAVAERVKEIIGQGRSVTAQKTIPQRLRYREIEIMKGSGK